MIQSEITMDTRRVQQLREKILRNRLATPEQLATWAKGKFTAEQYRSWDPNVVGYVLEVNPAAVDKVLEEDDRKKERENEQRQKHVEDILAGTVPAENSKTLGIEAGQIAFVSGHPELTGVNDGSGAEVCRIGTENSNALLQECIERKWLTTGENLQKVFLDLCMAGKLTLRIDGKLVSGADLKRYVYLHPAILDLHSAPKAPDPNASLSATELAKKNGLGAIDPWTGSDPNAKDTSHDGPARTLQVYETAITTFRSFHPEFVPSEFARNRILMALGDRPVTVQSLERVYQELQADNEFVETCIDRSGRARAGNTTLIDYSAVTSHASPPIPATDYTLKRLIESMSGQQFHDRFRQDPEFRERCKTAGIED